MSADECDTQWHSLVDWVIWIHDLYELSKEERLPLCWPQHPGLVEELRSLKVWRESIYNHPDNTVAHTARSWHGELRQTIVATATFWAPACRAGHTDARILADAHPGLAKQWHAATPPLMTSSPPAPARPTIAADEISNTDMAAALASGQAHQHSHATPFYSKLHGSWWTRSSDGTTWLRCTDPDHHAHLDTTSARLRAADAALDQLHTRKDNR